MGSSSFSLSDAVLANQASPEDVGAQIRAHHEADKQQSVLHSLLSNIWDGGSASSLKQMEQLQKEARTETDPAALQRTRTAATVALQNDNQVLEKREQYLNYATGALQVASFALTGGKLRGTVGLVGSIGVNALDTMHSGSTFAEQALEGTLGAGKGALLRGLYSKIGSRDWNPVSQATVGILTGATSRFGDYASDHRIYENGFVRGLAIAASRTFDAKAIAVDGATGLFAGGLLKGVHTYSGGGLNRATFAGSLTAGGVFGATNGASMELVREKNNNESFDGTKVITSSLINGVIGIVPGAIGYRGLAAGHATESVSPQAESANIKSPLSLKGLEGLNRSEPEPLSKREFLVQAGSINSFLQARAAGRTDRNAAMLRVSEILNDGKKDAHAMNMLVQHVNGPQDVVGRDFTKFGRCVAVCNGEAMNPDVRERFHVLPKVDGPIRLHANDDGSRIAFTADNGVALDGYPRSTRLGPAASLGERVQSELFQWLRTPIKLESGFVPRDEVTRRKLELQNAFTNGKWSIGQSQTGSAADKVGMDLILVQPGTGKILIRDFSMLDKTGYSEFRSSTVFKVFTDRRATNSKGIAPVADETKVRLVDNLLAAMSRPTWLSTKDTLIPNFRKAPSDEAIANDIASFRERLNSKKDLLTTESRQIEFKEPEKARIMRADAGQIRDYVEDLGAGERHARAQAAAAADPNRSRYEQNLTRNLEREIKEVVRAGLDGDLRGGRYQKSDGTIFYKSDYDQLVINTRGQHYVIENLSHMVAKQLGLPGGLKDSSLTAHYVDRLRTRLRRLDAAQMVGLPAPARPEATSASSLRQDNPRLNNLGDDQHI